MPVSTSPVTSANWQPLVPVEDIPISHPASVAIISVPSNLQASFQAIPFEGLSFTWMRPLLATKVAASTPRAGPTLAQSASRAFPAARRTGGITDAAVVLPPELPQAG